MKAGFREERRWDLPRGAFLEARTRVGVRFQEVDSLRIVWHGHYLTYCEEGRLAFGGEFDFGYEDIGRVGLAVPLVHAEVDFHSPARFGDTLEVRARLYPVPGSLLHFRYRITRTKAEEPGDAGDSGGELLATAFTVQAFTSQEGELYVTRPPIYTEFLERWAGRLEEDSA